MSDNTIARRAVIAGAGAGIAAGMVGAANAQSSAKPEIQASEHFANKGSVRLYLYRKRIVPKPGETQPVLFMVMLAIGAVTTTLGLWLVRAVAPILIERMLLGGR